jgi:hypothetical protein
MTTEPLRVSVAGCDSAMPLRPNSRAYGPTYRPTKSLEQQVAENPGNQFLADPLPVFVAGLRPVQYQLSFAAWGCLDDLAP